MGVFIDAFNKVRAELFIHSHANNTAAGHSVPLFITTVTSYEQYCEPHAIPFGMKNLNMYCR
jgi:hypothetical protein